MTRRSARQIQESLLEQYKVWRRGSGTDLPPLEGGGTAGLGSVTTSKIPRNIQGPAGKPHYKIDPISKEPVLQNPKVWRRGEPEPVQQSQLKVWRRGEPPSADKPSVAPAPQTAQERLIAQAQADAAAGKPTLAVTDPRISKVLDRLFPEKLADLAKQRIEPKLDEEQKPEYTKEQYIGWAKKYADQYSVPLPLVLHSMFKETGWLGDPERMRTAKSPTGARGVMQIQPQYAEKGYGIKVKDLTDPEKNIEAGVRGLGRLLDRYKSPEKALAAYNAGEGGAAQFLKTGDVNTLRTKETRNYIKDYKDDVTHQLEKFFPKNKQKVAQVATDVLSTAVGAKDVQAGDEVAKVKPGYYALGDSHAEGVAGYSGKPWTNLGLTGSSAFDPRHQEALKTIPPGSVVAISLGANDLSGGKYKTPEIVDQVNKIVTDAKARGLNVVYLLPTASSNPKYQQSREDFRTALSGSVAAPIVDLGIAPSKSEKNPRADDIHQTKKVYQNIAQDILKGYQPVAQTTKQAATKAPGEETFFDKVKRVASGELASQVFGDKKKSAPAVPAPVATDKQPPKDSEPSWFEKLYGIPQARERVQAQKADIEKQEQKRKEQEKKEQPPKTVQSVSGKIEYPAKPAAITEPKAPAKAPPIELQKDQAGLTNAYKGSAAAQAIMQQNPDIIKNVNRIRAGDTIKVNGQDYTIKPGDTLDQIARKMKSPAASVVPASAEKPEVAAGTQTTDRFQAPAPAPESPAKSEIQTAMRDFDRQQTIDRLMKQADEPSSTPAPRTPEELASDELWSDIRKSAAGKSSEELSAAAKKAMQDLDAELQSNTPATKTPTATQDLGTITIGEPQGEYKPPVDVTNFSASDREKQRQRADMDSELKESINTQSLAELHDILRLAGRTK